MKRDAAVKHLVYEVFSDIKPNHRSKHNKLTHLGEYTQLVIINCFVPFYVSKGLKIVIFDLLSKQYMNYLILTLVPCVCEIFYHNWRT